MRDTFFAFQILLGIMWPVTVYASNETFEAAMFRMDLWGIAAALALATLSGLTALLSQIKKDYELNGKISRLWLYVTSKMAGSNLAGLVGYFVAISTKQSPSWTAVIILIAAFGGTWLLERAVQAAADKYLPTKEDK